MDNQEIFTVKTGLGAAHGDTIDDKKQKIYYPWEPDVIGCPQQTGGTVNYAGWDFPGGVHYNSGLKSDETNTNGNRNLEFIGGYYEGDETKGQIHSKYAIFHGEKEHIGSRTNFGSDSPPTLRDFHNQIIGYHVVRFRGYMNTQDACIPYVNYSKSSGTLLPVYGLTMDFTVCKGVCTTHANGDNYTNYTSNGDFAKDIQINQVHGLWAKLPGGEAWISKKFLPNGDNWGGMSSSRDPENGKYVFYDNQDLSSSGERRLLGSNSQSEKFIDYDKKGNDIPYTLKLLMNANEHPPSGYAFMGFTMCFTIGTEAKAPHDKYVIINNVNVIDRVNAEKMRDHPEYHGPTKKAKTDGFTDVLVPKPQGINGIGGSLVELYGPRRYW